MNKFRVLWAPTALDDLKDIYDHIYEQSPKGADIVFDTLLDLGDSLETLPERFPIQAGLPAFSLTPIDGLEYLQHQVNTGCDSIPSTRGLPMQPA